MLSKNERFDICITDYGITTPFLILLADYYLLLRREVKRILQNTDDIEVIGEASDGTELLELLKKTTPHMVILDIAIPNLRAARAIREIKIIKPDVKVLIFTMRESKAYLNQALTDGAEGYLLKEDADSELLSAIETVRKGGTYISPRLFNS
jgi:two-component system, NarL family, response regulator NreC